MKLKIIDTSLRDGSHSMNLNYSLEDIRKICSGLDDSGVYAVEVGHGAGIGADSSHGVCKEKEEDMLKTAASVLKKSKLAAVIITGIGNSDAIYMAYNSGVEILRVGIVPGQLSTGLEYIRIGKKLNMIVMAFFMMVHYLSSEELAEGARMASECGADVIYLTDSAGALLPNETVEKVKAVKKIVKNDIGIHCHNNLGLSVGNSVLAVENGATYVDGTLQGLGPHSGNAPTEAIVAVLEKMGYETGANFFSLLEVSDKHLRPIISSPIEVTSESMSLAYAEVYSVHYEEARKIAKKCNLNHNEIFREMGKRKKLFCSKEDIITMADEMRYGKKVILNDIIESVEVFEYAK